MARYACDHLRSTIRACARWCACARRASGGAPGCSSPKGVREVERALAAGLVARQTFYAPELLPAWPHGGEEVERTRARQDGLPRRAGGCARRLRDAAACSIPADATLLVVAVGIEKPGNLGAIARSADAAGADGILVADGEVDPWNPNAIRASTGSVFTLPIVEATRDDVASLTAAEGRRGARRRHAPLRRRPDETDRVPDRRRGHRPRRHVARDAPTCRSRSR